MVSLRDRADGLGADSRRSDQTPLALPGHAKRRIILKNARTAAGLTEQEWPALRGLVEQAWDLYVITSTFVEGNDASCSGRNYSRGNVSYSQV
jgi:hypothetical protein